mgnify:CR=1 FL=1
MHNPFLNLSNDEKSMIRLFAGLGEHEKEQLMAYMHNRLDDQINLYYQENRGDKTSYGD